MNAPLSPASKTTATIADDPCFNYLVKQTHKSESMREELVACVTSWIAAQLEQHRRMAPAVGLSNPILVEMGRDAGLTEADESKLVAYARRVLGAATRSSPKAEDPTPASALRRIEALNIQVTQTQAQKEHWQKSCAPMLETLRDISVTAPDPTTRKNAQEAIAAAFPKKDSPWKS